MRSAKSPNRYIYVRVVQYPSKQSCFCVIFYIADVVELADAADSKSAEGNLMGVRFSPSAPIKSRGYAVPLIPSILEEAVVE